MVIRKLVCRPLVAALFTLLVTARAMLTEVSVSLSGSDVLVPIHTFAHGSGGYVNVTDITLTSSNDISTLSLSSPPLSLILYTGSPVTLLPSELAENMTISECTTTVEEKLKGRVLFSANASFSPLAFPEFSEPLPAGSVVSLSALNCISDRALTTGGDPVEFKATLRSIVTSADDEGFLPSGFKDLQWVSSIFAALLAILATAFCIVRCVSSGPLALPQLLFPLALFTVAFLLFALGNCFSTADKEGVMAVSYARGCAFFGAVAFLLFVATLASYGLHITRVGLSEKADRRRILVCVSLTLCFIILPPFALDAYMHVILGDSTQAAVAAFTPIAALIFSSCLVWQVFEMVQGNIQALTSQVSFINYVGLPVHLSIAEKKLTWFKVGRFALPVGILGFPLALIVPVFLFPSSSGVFGAWCLGIVLVLVSTVVGLMVFPIGTKRSLGRLGGNSEFTRALALSIVPSRWFGRLSKISYSKASAPLYSTSVARNHVHRTAEPHDTDAVEIDLDDLSDDDVPSSPAETLTTVRRTFRRLCLFYRNPLATLSVPMLGEAPPIIVVAGVVKNGVALGVRADRKRIAKESVRLRSVSRCGLQLSGGEAVLSPAPEEASSASSDIITDAPIFHTTAPGLHAADTLASDQLKLLELAGVVAQ